MSYAQDNKKLVTNIWQSVLGYITQGYFVDSKDNWYKNDPWSQELWQQILLLHALTNDSDGASKWFDIKYDLRSYFSNWIEDVLFLERNFNTLSYVSPLDPNNEEACKEVSRRIKLLQSQLVPNNLAIVKIGDEFYRAVGKEERHCFTLTKLFSEDVEEIDVRMFHSKKDLETFFFDQLADLSPMSYYNKCIFNCRKEDLARVMQAVLKEDSSKAIKEHLLFTKAVKLPVDSLKEYLVISNNDEKPIPKDHYCEIGIVEFLQ